MIKTIIFDFGDVFLNLKKEEAMQNALQLFKMNAFTEDMILANETYEQGLITTEKFLEFYLDKFPKINKQQIIEAWNKILGDLPKHRFYFLKQLEQEKQFQLILLSNTNELHINWIKEHIPLYYDFKACFDAFYLSHEVRLRKPNLDIFQFVLDKHKLRAEETLFIDDTKENTDAALQLSINVWNNNPRTEDVTDLFKIKKELFNN